MEANKKRSIGEEKAFLRTITTKEQATELLAARLEHYKNDPRRNFLPDEELAKHAKFVIQCMAETFFDGEETDKLYELFDLDPEEKQHAQWTGAKAARSCELRAELRKKASVVKQSDTPGESLAETYAPLLLIKTQQQADDFLKEYSKNFTVDMGDLKGSLESIGMTMESVILFTLQSAVESFVRPEEQQKLLYSFFKFDESRKQDAIDGAKFAMSFMNKDNL